VPRAKPFVRTDVERRWRALEIDPLTLEKLVTRLPIDPNARSRFASELYWAIRAYRARALAAKQARPAKILAALKPGIRHARKLSDWLNSLPQSVRLELRSGQIEGLLSDLAEVVEALSVVTRSRAVYWQTHVRAHRPAGASDASLAFRQSLMEMLARFLPDNPTATPRQKRTSERNRLRHAADIMRTIGAPFPSEKKNRGRFKGDRASKSNLPKPLKPRKKRHVKGTGSRARDRRLKGVVF
jgi:hypothetical protein